MAQTVFRLRHPVVCLRMEADHASSLAAGEIVVVDGAIPRKPATLVNALHRGRPIQIPSDALLEAGEIIDPAAAS